MPKDSGTPFEVSIMPIRGVEIKTYMARLPAGAFVGWIQSDKSNQRTYRDGNGRLEVTRHVDVAEGNPKAVERLDVTDSVNTLANRVMKHIKAVKQSGPWSDQPVHLLYWPHTKDSISQLFRTIIVRTLGTSILNDGTRLIDLSAVLEWSPFLTTYT